jgi:hypothetical protein
MSVATSISVGTRSAYVDRTAFGLWALLAPRPRPQEPDSSTAALAPQGL